MDSSLASACNRRRFLRALGGASTVTIGIVTTPLVPAQAYDPGQAETAPRYRESEHVKTFYRTNRYEGVKK